MRCLDLKNVDLATTVTTPHHQCQMVWAAQVQALMNTLRITELDQLDTPRKEKKTI